MRYYQSMIKTFADKETSVYFFVQRGGFRPISSVSRGKNSPS